MKKKIFMLFALLMTAATGAWAQFSTASGEVSSKINTKKALKAPIRRTGSGDAYDLRYAVKRGGSDNAYLQYSTEDFVGGVGTGGGAVWWGIRFPAADLAVNAGQILTQVGIFTDSDGDYGWTYSGNYTVRVYQGGDTAPGTLVSEATEYLPGDMAWHDITLTTPVEIDATQDLWLTFYTPDIAYPMSGCTYTGNPNSDFLSTDGSTWEHAATDYGLDYTWMIRANIESCYDLKGETGECSWGYKEDTKTLTIYGNGAMEDYADVSEQPWADFALDIETLIIKGGVTHIGDRAFHSLKQLSFATIPAGMLSIGDYAFYDCVNLPFVSIPASVTDMGLDAFWKCLRLRNIYMYADVNNLAWKDTDCDDFTFGTLAVCHVAGDVNPWKEKFDKKVNVSFKADLEEIPVEYAAEGAFNIEVVDNQFGTVTTYVDGDAGKKAKAGAAVMVVVEPMEGYIAELIYGHGYIKWEEAAARAEEKTMNLINELEVSKLKDNVWSFAMPGADVKLSVVYRKLMTNGDITIDPIDDMQYTGETLKPEVTVKDGETVLEEGVDYEVEYTQTFAAGEAFLTVKGIGDYAGETTASFFIGQKSGDGLTVEVADAEAGKVPAITVKDGDMELFAEYDYDITFVDGDGNAVTEEQMAEGGTFKALIELKHNYTGSLSKTFSVAEPETTGITTTNYTNDTNDVIFDLSGRKVSKAVKGVYVKNGRKVVIK